MEGLHGRDDPEGAEARVVGGMDGLDVLDPSPAVARAVGTRGRLVCVQGHAHAAVADGVEVDLEARPVGGRHRLREALRGPVRQAEAEGRVVAVGLEEGRRVRLDDTVHVALHASEANVGVVVQRREPAGLCDRRVVLPLLHTHCGCDPHA